MIKPCSCKLASATVTTSPNPFVLAFTIVPNRRPIYIISDLHAGDGGPRDNFAYGNREALFNEFLDFVEARNGQLIIAGDLLDFWQANLSKVVTHRLPLLNRLAKMDATYVIGNHDSDLNYFIGKCLLNHPIMNKACRSVAMSIAGRLFNVIHGHEADPYCISDIPGLGRITAILSGMAEDKHGGPVLNEYETVEAKVLGPMDRVVSHLNWLRGKPDRYTAMNRALKGIQIESCDVLISGHTHKPGRIGSWYYNSGTWAEFVNSFIVINTNGVVGVFDWNGRAVPNNTELSI